VPNSEGEPVLTDLEEAITSFRGGGIVIIVDDEDRENEGDLVIAAEHVTPAAINFMATHGRGLICLALPGATLDRLQIPMMVPELHNRSGFGTGFTISVEAARGVTTGISAADRARTVRTLIDPETTPADIAMPGHVFPLRARQGGVLERRGQTEASVDLARLAGLVPGAVICEVMEENGEMMRLPALLAFAREHGLATISVEQIARHRLALGGRGDATAEPDASNLVSRAASNGMAVGISVDTADRGPGSEVGPSAAEVGDASSGTRAGLSTGMTTGAGSDASEDSRAIGSPLQSSPITLIGRSRLPTARGEFDIAVFRDEQGLEHSALIRGELTSGDEPPLARVHSECLTGDAFGSLRCDCGAQLDEAMRRVEEAGRGIILYLRQEGRGIGLGNKIRAYTLQDGGLDTVEANRALGFPDDARRYEVAAAMLEALGVSAVRLMSNNPDKRAALASLGIDVAEQVPIAIAPQRHNEDYLRTKVERMGHELPVPTDSPAPLGRPIPDGAF